MAEIQVRRQGSVNWEGSSLLVFVSGHSRPPCDATISAIGLDIRITE